MLALGIKLEEWIKIGPIRIKIYRGTSGVTGENIGLKIAIDAPLDFKIIRTKDKSYKENEN